MDWELRYIFNKFQMISTCDNLTKGTDLSQSVVWTSVPCVWHAFEPYYACSDCLRKGTECGQLQGEVCLRCPNKYLNVLIHSQK